MRVHVYGKQLTHLHGVPNWGEGLGDYVLYLLQIHGPVRVYLIFRANANVMCMDITRIIGLMPTFGIANTWQPTIGNIKSCQKLVTFCEVGK
jgi:hypothetical protein